METQAEEHAEERDYEDLTGRTIAGRYVIKRLLGAGGMGVVYSAIDQRLDKAVAIKVLKESFAHRKDVVARFTLEAKSAARIKHENILDVTDYGETEDGSFYIAMELLDGTDLNHVLQKGGPIDPQRAIGLAIQVTRALSIAHQKGVVHRDLKPENVFLVKGDDGRELVKIVDFGIAQMKDLADSGGGGESGGRKLTRTGMIFGTPEYMSPEQAAGKTIDHRVDIYATGIIIYEMLAGRPPFLGDNFMGVLTLHMFEQVPPISSFAPAVNLPAGLEDIVLRALAKNATDRYGSMDELGQDLQRVREGLSPSLANGKPEVSGTFTAKLPAVPKPSELPEHGKRSGTLIAVGIGLVAVLAVVGGLALRGGTSAPVPTPPPPRVAQPSAPPAPPPVGAQNNPPAVVQATAEAGTAPQGPALARLLVASSEPSRVEVEGDSSLQCEQTPCELRLAVGRQVRLVATAGARRGELSVAVERDGQGVTVQLQAPRVSNNQQPRVGRNPTGSNPGGGTQGGRSTRCVEDHGNWHRWDTSLGIWMPCSPP